MGGSSGGGSGEPPGYVQTIHEDWLARQVEGEPMYTIDVPMTELMNEAISPGGNPFTTALSFDPEPGLQRMREHIKKIQSDVELSALGDNDELAQIGNQLAKASYSRLEATILQRYHRGMQNINAVNTSAFAVGRAVIYAMSQDNVDSAMGQMMASQQEWRNSARSSLLHYGIEVERMGIAAGVDAVNQQNMIHEAELRWPLEVFQYGGNLIASVTGGTVPTAGPGRPSAGASAIGGAMSGASIGTQIKPGVGTAVGAVVGAVAGLVSR